MAEKNTYTNATALAACIELAAEAGEVELVEKLNRMYETTTKPRSKSRKLTSEQQQMLRMVDEVIAKMANEQEPVGTEWVCENVKFCGSSQKATALMKKAIATGKVVKAEPEKGKVRYKLA